MNLERKTIWAMKFGLAVVLFSTLSSLFSGYMYTFIKHDKMASYALITHSMVMGILFFCFFTSYVLRKRFNQFKKLLPETTDVDDELLKKKWSKNDIILCDKIFILHAVGVILILLNYFFAIKASTNDNYQQVFLHMVMIVWAALVYSTVLLVYDINNTFKKLEKLVLNDKKKPEETF